MTLDQDCRDDMTRHCALDLVRDLDFARHRAVILHDALMFARGRDVAYNRARDIADDLARRLDITSIRLGGLDMSLTGTRDVECDFAFLRRLAHSLVGAFDRDLDGLAFDHVRRDAVNLTLNLENWLMILRKNSRDLIAFLDESPAVNLPVDRGRQRSGLAVHVLAQAVRGLPVAHRARYAEEFRSELADIAQAGSRCTQLAYAIRVAARIWGLRAALQDEPPDQPERIGSD